MSSKDKTAASKEEAKPALVPKLRFPEFRGAGEWKTVNLGAVATISTERVGNNTCVPMSITSGVGLVSQKEKFGRVIAGDSYKNYVLLKPNNFAYNKSATKEYPEGFLALYSGTDLAAVPNSIFTCFGIKGKSPDVRFLNYQFLGNLHGRWLRKFIQVGARAHGSLNINDGDLMALPIPIPAGAATVLEQKKITDFLSSVDELIAAHARKLEALKTHKKGLMQKLFPREGETRPRFRFVEFQDAEDWEEKTLGQLAKLVRGPFGGSLKKEIFVASGYAVYEQQHAIYCDFSAIRYHITAEKFHELRRFAVAVGDIIMSCSGTMGKFAIVPSGAAPGVINQALLKLTPSHLCDTNFLKELLELPSVQEKLLSQSAGGAIQNVVSVDQIKVLPLRLPTAEEQRAVVGCLSSLDTLIATEKQKLEAVKTHKRGLMQQMFPSLEEEE